VAGQIAQVTTWATQNYPTGNQARAGGWSPATVFFHGIAAHYLQGGTAAAVSLDSVFDPLHPEVLLYGDGPNPPLVGINYIVWHEHGWLCVDLGRLLVVSEAETQAGCAAQGLFGFDFHGNWLLHVWSIPGWDAPEGIFSHENSKV
jgi:hypothetical protein